MDLTKNLLSKTAVPPVFQLNGGLLYYKSDILENKGPMTGIVGTHSECTECFLLQSVHEQVEELVGILLATIYGPAVLSQCLDQCPRVQWVLHRLWQARPLSAQHCNTQCVTFYIICT